MLLEAPPGIMYGLRPAAASLSASFCISCSMKPNLCTTYSAQVIAHIKESLLSGVLRPGDPVREAALAEKLGISRGPVREAVQALALEGLVSNLPQKAKYIRRMSAKEIEDSYCMCWYGTSKELCTRLTAMPVPRARPAYAS